MHSWSFFPNPISTICKHCVPLSLLLLELVFPAFPVFLLSSPRRVVDLEICLLNMNLDRRGGRRHFYGAFLFPFCFSFLRYSTAVHCSSRTRPGPKVVHGKLIEKRRKKITLRIQICHYLSSSKQFLQCTQCLENGNHQKSLILQHFKNLAGQLNF